MDGDSWILSIQDKAFTGCMSMGCHHWNDVSSYVQLCPSLYDDGRCHMSKPLPCCSNVLPIHHPDGWQLVMEHVVDEVYAIGDVGGDITTVHDNALADVW